MAAYQVPQIIIFWNDLTDSDSESEVFVFKVIISFLYLRGQRT